MTLFNRSAALVAAAAAGLAFGSCAGENIAGQADGPTVVAAFYPLAYLTDRVAGEDAHVTNLTQPGVEAHDMELTGQQVAQIADADLVVYLHGFQPAVDEAIAQNASEHALDVAAVVDTHTTHEDDDHGHDTVGDPHIWLNPAKMTTVAEAVADRLAEIAPSSAGSFHEHADQLIDDLQKLDEDYRAGLSECQRRVFVTSHSAFGHLAERYDLEMVGVSGIDPEAEPSPARLAEVQRVVEAEDVTTIFYERLVSPAVAEALASDLSIEATVLDPIEGLTDETMSEDYLTLMRDNLEALREANGCA